MKRTIFFLGILIILIFSLNADTDEYLKITNETGFTIAAIFISDTSEDDWGDDYLDGGVLNNKDSVEVSLDDLDSRTVNVRGRDDEGDTYTVYGIRVGSDIVRLTLNDIDPD